MKIRKAALAAEDEDCPITHELQELLQLAFDYPALEGFTATIAEYHPLRR